MRRRIKLALALTGAGIAALISGGAEAQNVGAVPVASCGTLTGGGTYAASSTLSPLTQTQSGQLCISGSISATSSATAGASVPSLAAGTQNFQEELSGGLFVHPVFGPLTAGAATPVDATHGLPVNIVAGGGAGGTSSSFGAAFPATGTAIGAKNGANMVNLTADASNNLDVNLQTALPAGANTIGGVTQATSPWVDSVTTWGGGTLGAMANYGTSPGAVLVPGVNAFITNTPTVTANAGANLNTSALALDTSVNGLLLGQASTTSTQKGPLAQAAVTAAAPSYTAGQTSPLSLTTAGALRTDASATTQPVSGTVTANADRSASGTITTLNGTVSIGTTGSSTVGFQTSGSFVATIVGEVTYDGGTTWQGIALFDTNPGENPVNSYVFSITDAGPGTANVAGAQQFRIRAGAFTSGSITVNLTASTAVNAVTAVNLNPAAFVAGISQFGGTNILTGPGPSASGVPRVTVSNDSSVQTVPPFVPPDRTQFPGMLPPVREIGDGAHFATFAWPNAAAPASAPGLVVAVSPNSSAAVVQPNAALLQSTTVPATGAVFSVASGQLPLQVALAPTLPQRPFMPSQGGSITLPNAGAQASDRASVVSLSPNPSPQCPFQVYNFSSTSGFVLVSGTAGKRIIICDFDVVMAAAESISVVEGTGSVCGTGTTGIFGNSTASVAFAANGGISKTSPVPFWFQKNGGDDLCFVKSGSGNASGSLAYGLM